MLRTPPRKEVPTPQALQAALQNITETLARALGDGQERAPEWSEFEWAAARAVAAMHGVSPLMSRALHWKGPPGWMQFLHDQRVHTANRHARFDELLRRIDERLAQSGIAAVALKGVALHAMGFYCVGDRPMADIDLLVRPIDAERTARALGSLGFRQSSASWKERVFTPIEDHAPIDLGEHSNNDLKIELHERICERLPSRITDASERIFPSQPHPGLNGYASKASLMIHLLLHAAGSMPIRAVRLLQLHDLALLSAKMTDSDWDEVLSSRTRRQRLWWAFPPLKLTSRYYSSKIPARVLSALAGECPFVLRGVANRCRLYEVSLSYLWVEAFPGIAWSQSFFEAIEYAVRRLRPTAQTMVLREYIANTQNWGKQGDWARLSQSRRILRWLSSRQTRPVTMNAVYAALNYAK
jgi:Uncharacterised nucleotidyltransferase